MKQYSAWAFIATVIIFPITVFGVVRWYENAYTPLPVLGPEKHRIQSFDLVSQYDEKVSLNQWEDKIVVANFFFTHCPVVCPKMTRSLKRVQELYPGKNDLLFSSFSVDPGRDSVSRLKDYAAQMDIRDNWLLLTGDKKQIYRLARKSFLVSATDGDGGPQDFIHSELLILVDKNKRIRGYYNGTIATEVDDLIRDISRLKKEE
jgi:protein SCO1